MVNSQNAACYREVEINTATPLELVVLMYDAAISSLQQAGRQLAGGGDIASRARCLNKVSSILTELQASLDFETGGEIARSLDRLYAYMRNRVFEANLHQDRGAVEEVIRLLAGLRSAWVEVVRREAKKHEAGRENPHPTEKTPPVIPVGQESLAVSGLSVTA
ncbi:MAG: flagellar export chaperone FliS [Acidobacteria bacterium]|nr:flagellar export chaperone FliS [Acidobacteriota bacterium]